MSIGVVGMKGRRGGDELWSKLGEMRAERRDEYSNVGRIEGVIM